LEYKWVGEENKYLDHYSIKSVGKVSIGCFGGSTETSANKNEDAAYILQHPSGDWIFAVLLDAHHGSDSAKTIIRLLESNADEIKDICNSPSVFQAIEPFMIRLLTSESFKRECSRMLGETSCLFCFQSGAYVWWMSIGDCMAFIFHSELARFRQYQLNQRQFFEWIGRQNSLGLPVLCYSSGRRQLRQGLNLLVLSTDGWLEAHDEASHYSEQLYQAFYNEGSNDHNLHAFLKKVMDDQTRDSTTMIVWEYLNQQEGLYPSDEKRGKQP
jgi:hypothetical protein